MDDYEATRIVFSRVQNLDPENASKIMGLLLLQDHEEKEMIRLAFGPEALIHSIIHKARKDLGLHSNSSSSPFLPCKSISISRQSFANSRPGITLPSIAIPNPYPNPDDFLISPNNLSVGSSSSSLPPYGDAGTDTVDEFQLQDQLSFFNDGSLTGSRDLHCPPSDLSSSPAGGGSDLLFPSYSGGANWSDDSNFGVGWTPCLYYARGYCKNGSSCRFSHSAAVDSAVNSMEVEVMEQCNELARSKSALQQRLAAASANYSFPYSPKSVDFLLQQQQNEIQSRVAVALKTADDSTNLGSFQLERNGFSMNCGVGLVNPAARQIYLTFPADSTFKEEDVSKYFSIYGPVQDVRIPYQQKRMFGFVSFVYPETVKLILAKGNPHFVCDSRVLVKPYKEKGRVPEKFRKQHIERGDFSPCGTPTSLDSRELHDPHLGARMFYNSQDMLWRRKLEERADLQQALELQTRRLLSLQLLDVKKPQNQHPPLSTCSPIPSPTQSHSLFDQNLLFPSVFASQEALQDNGSNRLPEISVMALAEQQMQQKTDSAAESEESNGNEIYLQEISLEHNLPESPFASSPFKAGGIEADGLDASADDSATSSRISASNLGISSFKCQYPSGHGAIGMYAGSGGPTCPVGI